MKRLLLIVLLLAICISVVASNAMALEKSLYQTWREWDESLPLWDSKYWNWSTSTQDGRYVPIAINTPSNKNILFLMTGLHFFCTKDYKKQASIIIYSPGKEAKYLEEYNIPNPKFALVVFPPKTSKEKVIVRAYEITDEESSFLEEWKISFKHLQPVVSKDVKFREIFLGWLIKQLQELERQGSEKDIEKQKEVLVNILPCLFITDENKLSFFIG